MAERRPPELMDELVEEILLRIPPDDPARLARAAIACKSWCRLVSGPAFRRRFCELHRTPPVLGVIPVCDARRNKVTRFAATCSIRPPRADRVGWVAHDSRHGRVLLNARPWRCASPFPTAAWDPITGELRELPALPSSKGVCPIPINAALLCAAATTGGGCDHLDCCRGPFVVILVCVQIHHGYFTYIYSSEADAWGAPAPAPISVYFIDETVRAAHVGNALYFLENDRMYRIFKYDLSTRKMTLIDAPPMSNKWIVLTTADDGGLGCVTVEESTLHLWSRVSGPNGDTGWARCRAIEFKMQLPAGVPLLSFDGVNFGDDDAVVVSGTKYGYFTTDLKSGSIRKLGDGSFSGKIIPYITFYMPALRFASIGEGPRAGVSSA